MRDQEAGNSTRVSAASRQEPRPRIEPEIEAQEIEFDLVAGWTEDAVRELGPEYAIPAGCRGSGSPSDLAWLAEALQVGPDTRVADVGSGVGGPAAWLADHFGPQPVCVEPMRGAAAAGQRLFGLPTVVAAAEALPLRSGAFDAVECLGVLCTVPRPQRPAVLRELRRVLATRGRPRPAGVRRPRPQGNEALPGPLPEGNDFPTEEALTALLDGGRVHASCRPWSPTGSPRPRWRGRSGPTRWTTCWPATTATTRVGSGRSSRRRGSPA